MNWIFYQTKTQFSNIGDALINRCLIAELRQYGTIRANSSPQTPQHFLQSLSLNGNEVIQSGGQLGFAWNVLKKAMYAIAHGDKVYICSGLGHIYGHSNRKMAQNLLAASLFMCYRLLGVSIVRIGFGIGPISKLLAVTESLRAVFVNHYLVRDSHSLQLCHSIGISKAKLCPDMSWLYRKYYTPQQKATNSSRGRVINFSLRSLPNSHDNQILFESAERLLSFFLNHSPSYQIIVSYQVAQDKKIAKDLFDFLKIRHKSVAIREEQLTLENAGDFYGNIDFNISNRLHSLLLGYYYEALPVALIDYDCNGKITSLFEDINMGSLLVDLHHIDGNKVESIIHNKNELMNRIHSIGDIECGKVEKCIRNIFV